jgi:hypothetical protein
MRFRAVCAGVAFALAAMTIPAEAAWKSYVSRTLGFSFEAPGEVKATKGTWRAAVAGDNPATIYRSSENNINYRVTVVDFAPRAAEGSVIMEEAAYIMQDDMKVLMNDFGRVQTGKDAVYGRRMTFDLPENGGRRSVATYFTKGKLYILDATVLPANGDFTGPDAGRFIDSLVFDLAHTQPGATELTLPR